MATTHVRSATLTQRWLEYDASQYQLGDLASKIAMNLMGKDQPTYQPSELNGAFVVVVNAAQVRLSGTKRDDKSYDFYSGYPGGLKTVSVADMLARRPADVIRLAVKRMLPKSTLGRDMRRRLKIYSAGAHPHIAQQPVKVEPTQTKKARS